MKRLVRKKHRAVKITGLALGALFLVGVGLLIQQAQPFAKADAV